MVMSSCQHYKKKIKMIHSWLFFKCIVFMGTAHPTVTPPPPAGTRPGGPARWSQTSSSVTVSQLADRQGSKSLSLLTEMSGVAAPVLLRCSVSVLQSLASGL